MPDPGFWEQPEQVEAFAGRAPDRRLLELLSRYEDPYVTRVLDLGCAGGRNTVVLAECGFDFHALDASEPMIERTRERVSAIIGRTEATKRVARGSMDELGRFETQSFDLIVALGVLHSARSEAEWDCSLTEAVRVLRSGGRMLVANFSPRSDPKGCGLELVSGEAHVYEGFDGGRVFALEADQLDAEMSRHGLDPEVPTTTVEVSTDTGCRVTVNALYCRQGINHRDSSFEPDRPT
jgi:SAM-dependent methyltransferase